MIFLTSYKAFKSAIWNWIFIWHQRSDLDISNFHILKLRGKTGQEQKSVFFKKMNWDLWTSTYVRTSIWGSLDHMWTTSGPYVGYIWTKSGPYLDLDPLIDSWENLKGFVQATYFLLTWCTIIAAKRTATTSSEASRESHSGMKSFITGYVFIFIWNLGFRVLPDIQSGLSGTIQPDG